MSLIACDFFACRVICSVMLYGFPNSRVVSVSRASSVSQTLLGPPNPRPSSCILGLSCFSLSVCLPASLGSTDHRQSPLYLLKYLAPFYFTSYLFFLSSLSFSFTHSSLTIYVYLPSTLQVLMFQVCRFVACRNSNQLLKCNYF